MSNLPLQMANIANVARVNVLKVANRVGAVHFGGIFSMIDFLTVYYKFYENGEILSSCENANSELLISKGHCYLAQLAVLDSIHKNSDLCTSYLMGGSVFWGHPKRIEDNSYFPISSGSLGQGIAAAQGFAFANKLQKKSVKTWCIIGDGELNEGVCQEAFLFSKQHSLDVVFVLDNNKQQSLDQTVNILDNGDLEGRMLSLDIKYFKVDGHCHQSIFDIISSITSINGPVFLELDTVKGKGVSFMEGATKWHSTRLRDNEFEMALEELLVQ